MSGDSIAIFAILFISCTLNAGIILVARFILLNKNDIDVLSLRKIVRDEFINSDKKNQTCLILEDDFEFTKDQEFVNNIINKFFNNVKKFDVLMLASNILNAQSTDYEFLQKIIDAQTLSGYIVHRDFAPILLQNYRESISLLQRAGFKCYPYCFDIYMKKLQPVSNWYCLNPKVGKQIESYSDIENRVVDYEC